MPVFADLMYLLSSSINLPNLKISPFFAIKSTVNKHKSIQGPIKHQGRSAFAKILSASRRLTIAEVSILDSWQGSEYASK